MNSDNLPSAQAVPSSRQSYLAWPPPGLEPLQGALWNLLRSFVPGSLLFALPLLLAIATEQRFFSVGPFGRSYWVPATTSLIALAILFDAAIRLARTIRLAAEGARLGYDLRTMLNVAVDGSRDTGFVIQGARVFAALTPDERDKLLIVRRIGPLAYLAATLWMPVGLAVAVLLALAGAAHSFAIWMITLVPAVLLILVGGVARAVEGTLERYALKRSKAASTKLHEELAGEAARWREYRDIVVESNEPATSAPANRRALRVAAVLAMVPAILLCVPVIAILGATIMGPVLARIAIPKYGATDRKLIANQVFEPYRLPVDSSITPQQAGEAFANISQAGRRQLGALERPAPQPVDTVISDRQNNSLGESHQWTDTIAKLLRAGGLSPEQRALTRRIAGHNVHAQFSRFARAPGIDFIATRYISPLPDTIYSYELPIPRFGAVREAAYMHAVLAFDQMLDGKPAEAERTMKEIITAGLLMSRDGPTLIDALIGSVIVGAGAHGLEQLYRAMGRTAEADVLAARAQARDLANEMPTYGGSAFDVKSGMQNMVEMVTAPRTSRAMRWESFAVVNIATPCINLHGAVFPDDPDFVQWLEKARSKLVKYPGDQVLFDLMRRGLMGNRSQGGACGIPFHMMRDLGPW